MYRIVVSDLDETLLREDDKRVSERDREAVRAVRELGVKFVPASGRGYKSIEKTLRELDLLDRPGEYVISFNGGAITENAGERLLWRQGIPFSLGEELLRQGLDRRVCVHAYTLETVYVWNMDEGERTFLRGRMEVVETDEPDLSFLSGQEIMKVLYEDTDTDHLRAIARELEPLTGECDVSYSSGRYLEFNRKGVNKGSGLRELARILGVDMADTIAIGDNWNDLSMIQAAGLGVGVANAVEEIKPLCGHVTEATCDESAVAEVLDRFILHP